MIALRASNNSKAVKEIRQWNNGKCELALDGCNRVFTHQKIQLKQDGTGCFSI